MTRYDTIVNDNQYYMEVNMTVNDIVDSLQKCSEILANPDKPVAEIITEVAERLSEIDSHIMRALDLHAMGVDEDEQGLPW